MNNCTVCDECFRNDNPNKIICDGVCRQVFHAECVNFNKDALLCYREMPNLHWFCDSCTIQTRSFNVSSPPFNKFNSTVVVPTSSPSYVQRSLPAANRKRKPISGAKPVTSSAFLATQSANVNRETKKANDLSSPPSKNEMRSINELVNSTCPNGSQSLTKSVINQSDVVQPKSKHNTVDFEDTFTEQLENASTSSSFAEVLITSPIAKQVPVQVKSSPIQPQTDSNQPRSMESQLKTQKIAYVSNFHPSVTEKEVIDYLLLKEVISSPEDVSCKKLVSPNAEMDSVSFVSFKVAVGSEIFHTVVNNKLWPDGVIAREFVNR